MNRRLDSFTERGPEGRAGPRDTPAVRPDVSLRTAGRRSAALERLLARWGEHYVLLMVLCSRILCLVGGWLTVYYIDLTLRLSPEMVRRLYVVGMVTVVFSIAATTLLALWETRSLRAVLARLRRGQPVDARLGRRAGCEAVLFSGRHHAREALLVPATTVLPICVFLRALDGASANILLQVAIGGFVGISSVLLMTYFAGERWMAPVTRHLLDRGIPVRFDAIAPSRLNARMNICFGLTIAVTVAMIGGLANQRVLDILGRPDEQARAVASLRQHTIAILLVAVLVGMLLARLLASSVARRVGELVDAMKRVEAGVLSERLQPTGNDEIDKLTRQFNAMVARLERHDRTIQDLNANLEGKVKRRTRQLSRSKHSLQRSFEKLKEHDRLKTEFFSNVSHELRTPLTMILLPVERVLQTHGGALGPEIAAMLEAARINGQRLLRLINQLLDFARLEAGSGDLRRGATDLNGLVRNVATAAQPLADQRGIELEIVLDAGVPAFTADQEKIDTVLTNLVSNALKFTPAGGTVRIETRLETSEPEVGIQNSGSRIQETCVAGTRPPGLASSRSPHTVRVTVSDTGIGIDPSDYDRVFERFVQIDGSMSREFAGTGLGLPLAKELIELHGGEIHVESLPGRGTSFWFTLPLEAISGETGADPPAEPRTRRSDPLRFIDLAVCDVGRADARRAERSAPVDAAKVLVVDDTPEMRTVVGELLADDYRVVFAGNGAEGLQAVAEEAPDLIISDAMMPRIDGYEFCRRIKARPETAHIPFVMLTAKAELSMKIEGLNCGADDYLSKPFNSDELLARVRSLLKLRMLHRELDQRNDDLETALSELKAMQTQLVHSEKMSSVGQLAAGIAHEINNSINAVYNGIQPLSARARQLERQVSELLAEHEGQNGADTVRGRIDATFRKIWKLAAVIENGAGRTARIVGDLKTFAHPGGEAFDWFDLHEALDVCLSLLANQMKPRIAVRRDYRFRGTLYGPSGQLNQVFMNILNNARQAIAGTGEITVATRHEADAVAISIRDTGSGIPEEIQARIFDPFFTTKPPGVGTGLGLSLSYGIVTGLGGTIECHSEPGFGTELVITLPCRMGEGSGRKRNSEFRIQNSEFRMPSESIQMADSADLT